MNILKKKKLLRWFDVELDYEERMNLLVQKLFDKPVWLQIFGLIIIIFGKRKSFFSISAVATSIVFHNTFADMISSGVHLTALSLGASFGRK